MRKYDAKRELRSAEESAGVTPIDHAADVGIEVRARSLPELFARAAAGMAGLLLAEQQPNRSDQPLTTREIEVEAGDVAALLVAWLRELLYLYASEDFLCLEAEIIELTDGRLRARARGITHHEPGGREIKGVTYHGLDVSQRDGEWRARVIFDV